MGDSFINKMVWVGLIGTILVMGQHFFDNLAKQGGTLTVITDGMPADTVKLRWEGPIQPPMLQKIYDAWQLYGSERRKILLSLNSNGGLVAYGGRIIKLLRKIRKSNILITDVGYGDKCLSMCVPIYLQGTERMASKRSIWMFHEVRAQEALSNNEVISNRSDIERWTQQIIDRYFKPAGLDKGWIRDMEIRIKSGDYWSIGAKLYQEKSGIIHKLY